MDDNKFLNPDEDPRNKRTRKEAVVTFVSEHKILTVLSVLLLIAVILLLIQSFTKPQYDVHLLYCGPTYANQAQIHSSLLSSAAERCSVSADAISISAIVWVPDHLIEQYKKQDLYYNGATNAEALQSFQSALVAGDYSILLIDPELYEHNSELDVFVPLDELSIGKEARLDDYALRLSALSLYDMPGFSELPEDTLLVLRKRSFIQSLLTNQKKRTAQYEKQCDAFRQLAK